MNINIGLFSEVEGPRRGRAERDALIARRAAAALEDWIAGLAPALAPSGSPA
jgi:hypothetical protein